MIGPERVGRLVADQLTARIGGRLAVLAGELGPVANGRDPMPMLVAAGQRSVTEVGIDDWPFLLVVVQRAPAMRRVDYTDAGEPVYEVRYETRVFVWVRGDGFEEVESVRGRLTLAVREVLLDRQQLEPAVRVDDSTVTEAYSDVGEETELGSVGAAFVAFSLTTREAVAGAPPLGAVADTAADTRRIPTE